MSTLEELGLGPELAQYMDETVIPLHQEMGMIVVGSFTVVDDEDSFVWIRRFEDTADRERVLEAVHGHPRLPGRGRHRFRAGGQGRVDNPAETASGG